MKKRNAFTLAEMMIVMLILTILLAAFAPLMTKKSKVDLSNPWRWANNNSDIYYGMGNNQTAMIGQNSKAATDPNAKLLINQSDTSKPFISFKYPDTGNHGMPITRLLNLRAENLNLSLSSNGIGGQYNTGFGFSSLGLNMTGNSNTALGYTTLPHNTSGHDNTAIGKGALFTNTTGYNNIAIGSGALYNNETGHDNVAIGFNACSNATGSNKVCIGNGSGPISTDSYKNTNDKIIYLGDENTVVYIPGHLLVDKYAILGKSNKNYTTFIRFDMGLNSGTSSKVLSSVREWDTEKLDGIPLRLHFAPNHTGPSGNPAGENALINALPNLKDLSTNTSIAVPGNFVSEAYNAADWGDGTFNTSSDRRLKNVKEENTAGLEQIRQLKIFNYTFKKDEKKTPRVGVIAQDLIKIFPDAVTTGEDGYLMIRTEDMFYATINAIKELDKMLQDLAAQVKTVVAQVAEHDTQIKALQKENNELKNKVQTLEKRLDAIEKKL